MRDDENLFEHLSLGQVLSRTVNVFVDRFDVYMTLGAVVLVPRVIFAILIAVFVGVEEMVYGSLPNDNDKNNAFNPDNPFGQTQNPKDDPFFQMVANHFIAIAFVSLLQFVISLVTTLVGEGAIMRAVADTYANQKQGWLSCMKAVWGQTFCSLLLANITISGILHAGAFLVVIWFWMAMAAKSGFMGFIGFLLAIVYLVAMLYVVISTRTVFPVVVVENKGPLNSIRRSFELSEMRRCYIFCAVFVLWFIRLLVTQLLHNIFSPSENSSPMAALLSTPTAVIIAFALDLIYLPLNSIIKMVIYASIRVNKEGLTQEVLQRELTEPVAYTAPTSQQDYRQVSLMEEPKDTVTNGLVSDFA